MNGNGSSLASGSPALLGGAIEEALWESTGSVQKIGPASWYCVLSNGMDMRVAALRKEEWLLIGGRLSPGPWATTGIDPWALLEVNFRLGGGVKLIHKPDDGGVFAQVELPLDGDADPRLRVPQACAGLKQAAELYTRIAKRGTGDDCSPVAEGLAQSDETPTGQGAATAVDLAELCGEAGWQPSERNDGALVVELDVPGCFAQAQVRVDHGGKIRVVAEIPLREGTPPPRCRQALGVLLLCASGAVRMARAAADPGACLRDTPPEVHFEVVFDSRPCAAEIAHAFAALSVAWRLHAREAALVRADERLAKAYLRAVRNGV